MLALLFYPASQKAFARDVYDPDVETFQATHQWQTVKQGDIGLIYKSV